MLEENANHLDESMPQVALLKMITGAWLSQAIYAAAALGVADVTKNGAKTSDEIAAAVGAEPRALYRILRLLASHQIFEEQADGRFAQTPYSECLEREAFGSVRAMAILCGEEHYRSWGDIVQSLQTGAPAFDRIYKQSFYDHLITNSTLNTTFNDAMLNMAILGNLAVCNAYPFTEHSTIVDMGGGHGQLLAAVLNQNTDTRGVLFDTAQTLQDAASFLATAGVEDRVTCQPGDFFVEAPKGGDYYLLARVLQNFNDNECITLLRNTRAAMNPGAKMLIIEMVIPAGNGPFFGKLSDVNMLVMTHGRERTKTEYAALLSAAGLRFTQVISTESPVSIIEGEALL
jgi:hypothetical protein